mmetsp:Transcript_11827/g.29151  ORF Transcript_11827/g.29151 Transcript_11827/m.29151 type:complete len:676 (+) Transcript_11827:172-2199(+)
MRTRNKRVSTRFDADAFLMVPGLFLKHLARDKPHERFLVCSPDLMEIRWSENKQNLSTNKNVKVVKAKDVQKVELGWKTNVFRTSRGKRPGTESCCLSLVLPSRTLDLECKTEKQRDQWAKAFGWLIQEHKSGIKQHHSSGVSNPFNIKHVAHVNTDFEWDNRDLEREFRLEDPLGKGSFGEVRIAVHKSSGLQIAVKLIELKTNGDKPEDIEAEVNVLKTCKHEGIVSYFGCAPAPDRANKLWILMELCVGGSLRDLLDTYGPLHEYQIQYITAKSLKALAYLHSKKIIHRDLKAGNILLTEKGEVKLTDFGISVSLGLSEDLNSIAGSPLWMSPEVINGKGASFRSDVWSLGITLIELAEGIPPNAGRGNAMEALQAIRALPAPRLSHRAKWSANFNGLLAKMLRKAEADRPLPSALFPHEFVSEALYAYAGKPSPLLGALKSTESERLEKREAVKAKMEREMKKKKKASGFFEPGSPSSSRANSSKQNTGGGDDDYNDHDDDYNDHDEGEGDDGEGGGYAMQSISFERRRGSTVAGSGGFQSQSYARDRKRSAAGKSTLGASIEYESANFQSFDVNAAQPKGASWLQTAQSLASNMITSYFAKDGDGDEAKAGRNRGEGTRGPARPLTEDEKMGNAVGFGAAALGLWMVLGFKYGSISAAALFAYLKARAVL